MTNNTFRTSLVLALAIPMCFGSGCKDGDGLDGYLDKGSIERLAAVPDGETILVSLKTTDDLDNLPLGDKGRSLSKGKGAILVDVPRAALTELAGQSGVSEVVVWGSGAVMQRLDFALREQLFEVAHDPARREESLPLIATFAPGTPDARSIVEALGAETRSLSGDILTLDASFEEVFAILSLPELVQLARPRMQHPSGR